MANGLNPIGNLLGKVDANGALLVAFDSSVPVTAARFLGDDGTAALPTFSFSGTGDGDNGMYLSAADTLGWSAGGTLRLSLSSTALTSTVPGLFPNGTVADPSVQIGAEGNGWYRGGSTEIAGSIGDANVVNWGTTGGDPFFQIQGTAGKLLFSSDVSLSRGAANRLTLATGDVYNLAPTAFGSLPTGAEGDMACITDSSTATWGATITGGGANNVIGFFNGANWTVMGA